MNRTDNKRITEEQSDRERGDLHEPSVNRNHFTTPMNP